MRLRVNSTLRAALIAAITAVGFTLTQAQAGDRTASQLTDHTTSGGGVTYNGYVFTMQLDKTTNFASRNFKEATYNTETSQWEDGDKVYASGNSDIETPLGTGYFWRMYCSAANLDHAPNFGTTLRLAGAASQAKLQTDFSDFTIGGLIAEDSMEDDSATNPAYWIYRDNVMDINGLNDVNMDINSNVMFSYKGSVNLKKGGTWTIHAGKTLTFNNNSSKSGNDTAFIFYENQALTVQGGGTLALETRPIGSGDSVVMRAGSSLLVTGEGTTVKLGNGTAGTNTINGNITVETGSVLNINAPTILNRTITNNGSVQFASDTVTLGTLGGFESTGTFIDYDGKGTANGFATSIVYTIMKGTGSTNLKKVNYDDQTGVALVEGKLTVAGEDYTKYYVNTDAAEISVKSASAYATQHDATLSTVYVKGSNDELHIDVDYSGAVEVTGTGAVVDIQYGVEFSGSLSDAKLTGEGTYALGSGATGLGSVTMDTGWIGTVSVDGGTIKDINLNNYGQTGSKVDLSNVTGYFLKAQEVFAPQLVLNTGDLTINNGYSTVETDVDSAYTFAGGIAGMGNLIFNKASGNVTQHLYFTGEMDDWDGTLSVVNGFTVYAQFSDAANDVRADINCTNGTLHLTADGNVEFEGVVSGVASLTVSDGCVASFTSLPASIGSLIGEGDVKSDVDLTLTGDTISSSEDEGAPIFTGKLEMAGGTLTVFGNVELADQLAVSEKANIVVAGGGSLALTGGCTIGSEAIKNDGSVYLTGLDVSALADHVGLDAHFDLAGHQTGQDNYYQGKTGNYVQVVDGGTSEGGDLTWGDKSGLDLINGRIIVGEDSVSYETYYVGGETSTSIIAAGAHAEDLQTIEVLENAKLSVDDGTMTAYIHANDGATVAGEYAQAVTQIAGNSTVAYEDGLQADRGKVQFSGDVLVTNYGATDHTFSVTNTNMVVKADAITMSEGADDHIQIACWVDLDTITNESGKLLYLEHLVSSDLASVSALSGEIMLISTQGDLTVQNLEIGAYQGVQVVKIEGETAPEATVTVTEALTGGSGRLFANLTFTDVDIQDGINPLFNVNGGGDNALTLGSTFGITDGTIVSLDAETINALANLANGQSLDLIRAYDQTALSYLGEYNNMSFDQLFARTEGLEGDYVVYATGESFGLKKTAGVPEPTTGTLSLLALVALAARRRRK